MGLDAGKELNITGDGDYNIISGNGGGSKSAVYIYGTISAATIEIHGPGGIITDGGVTPLPFETVINHGANIPIHLAVTSADGSTDFNVKVGPVA